MQIDRTWELPFAVPAVYQAWVSSDTVIPPATRMEIYPVVGGHYRLIMETPDFSTRNEGRFLLVEPNQRITYTWQWEGDAEVSTIDVQFSATDSGTRVELNHSGFVSEQSRAQHESGWDSYIEGFTRHLSK